MIKRLFKRFAYIRQLEAEILTLRRALDSASNHVALLESIKKSQAEQIEDLRNEVRMLKGHLNGSFSNRERGGNT